MFIGINMPIRVALSYVYLMRYQKNTLTIKNDL